MVRRQWLAERPPPAPVGAVRGGPVAAEVSAEPEITPLEDGSARARIFAAIAQLASPLKLTTTLAPAEPWRLGVRLTDAQGLALTVFIERVQEEARYYKKGGRLGLWYAREQVSDAAKPGWAESVLGSAANLLPSAVFDALADELPERPATPAAAPTSHRAGAPDGTPSDAPVDPANPYARAAVLGATEVERFFHVDYQFENGADAYQLPTTRIGVIYQCNQPCTFCQLAEMNTHIPPARIFAALDESYARGARRVILTGGEPTLCKTLPEYVRHARELGFTTIELQTNATLLDRADRVAVLREAGLTDAQVSLHGPDSEISDRLTGAPGTHQRTLAGIGHLLDSGARVLLNHLIFRDNAPLLPDFIDMVERRWGAHRARIIIQFHSPLNEFSRMEHARKHIARYTEYGTLLRQATDRARDLGYWVKDLQDPTGIPALCVFDADPNYLGLIVSQNVKARVHRWEKGWMTRVAACAACDLADACIGIPRKYIELHGEEEFHPIRLNELS